MGGFFVHGRERDYLPTTDLTALYGQPDDTSRVVDATDYYNRPDPAKQGNRRERRAKAAQARRNKK